MEPSHRVVAGRYRLLEPLGAGGMGTVWRAQDELLGRPVAVKEVAFPHGLSDQDRDVLRERTRREARAAARLDHPSAVTVYDVVEEDGAPFLVMELVEARTLSHVVRHDGPLSPQRTAQVGLALLGALEAAHRQGIVHRDVKPGNVLLGADGRVVLTDFGIATSVGDSSITSTGLLLGSPSYIAPERAKGQQPGPPSDLWSLGATLFTAVEGRPPFDGGEPLLTVTAVVTGEHAPFVAAGPLEEVLEGLLERDPAQRWTAGQARAALAGIASGAVRAPAPAAVPSPEAERRTERTSALPMGDVREGADAATAGPAAAPVPPVLPRPPRPAPAARPGRGRQGRTAVPLALLGLLLLVGLALAGRSLLDGRDDDTTPTAGAPSTTASPSASGPAAAGVPADWATYTDPVEGWTLRHPPGWQISDRGALKQFRDTERRWTLRIDYTDEPRSSALEAWQTASPGFASRLAGYRELRLEEVEYKGLDAADLEFTYSAEGADLHVLDRGFVSADGSAAYALYWQVPAADYEASLPLFEQLAAAFVPAG